jgi:hypothetical protein
MPGTNTLAYYENSLLMAVESFITMAQGGNFIQPFVIVTDAAAK